MKHIYNIFIFCAVFLLILLISVKFLLKLPLEMGYKTNLELVGKICSLLLLPFVAISLIENVLLIKKYKKTDEKVKKANNKIYYKYYIQENDYKIKEKKIGESITLEDIIEYMDYNALRNNDAVCCGIERGDDFVEVSFAEGEYQLRIFKEGNEKTETMSDDSKINEIIYRNINDAGGA